MLRSALVVLVAMGVATQVHAQSFGAEVRGGFAMPTGEWNEDDELETGFGFGGNVHAMFTPMLGAYAGWERWEFGVEDEPGFEDIDAKAIDTGFRAGAHLALPVAALPVSPYVRAGLFYGSTEIQFSGEGGSLSLESDDGIGFEAELGAGIRLGPTISFTPALMYRQHSAEFDAASEFGDNDTTVGYVALVLGMRFNLGGL